MRRWLDNLSGRERALVLTVLPLALIALGYVGFWQPLQAARAAYADQIVAYAQVTTMAAAAQGQPVAPIAATDASPLSTRITQSAEAAGLQLRRLEPEDDRIAVTLDNAAFATVILWLSDLEVDRSVLLVQIDMDRRVEPGTVSARLLLEAAP